MPTDALSWEMIVDTWPEFKPRRGYGERLQPNHVRIGWEWFDGRAARGSRSDEEAHSLCRDQAAELLCERGCYLFFGGGAAKTWCVYHLETKTFVGGGDPDRDLALRLAVVAVMEESDARATA